MPTNFSWPLLAMHRGRHNLFRNVYLPLGETIDINIA